MLASLWRHSNIERVDFFPERGVRETLLLRRAPHPLITGRSPLLFSPFYIRDIKRSLPGVIDLLITFSVALHPGGRVDSVAEQAVSGHLETHHASHAWSCKQMRRQRYANRLCSPSMRANVISNGRRRSNAVSTPEGSVPLPLSPFPHVFAFPFPTFLIKVRNFVSIFRKGIVWKNVSISRASFGFSILVDAKSLYRFCSVVEEEPILADDGESICLNSSERKI